MFRRQPNLAEANSIRELVSCDVDTLNTRAKLADAMMEGTRINSTVFC
jgi:hypothetical protein